MPRSHPEHPRAVSKLGFFPFLLLTAAAAGCDNGESLLFPEAQLSEIRIEPQEAVILSGREADFSAVLIDNHGQQLSPGSGAPQVHWSTDDPATAQVSRSGRVEGAGAGFTRVTASVGGLQASAIVIVQPVAEGLEFEGNGLEFEGIVGLPIEDGVGVRVEDSSGEGVEGVTVRFSPSPGSGSVDPKLVVTRSDGVARTSWTLGRRPGIHQTTASVPLPQDSEEMMLGEAHSASVLPGNHLEKRNPQQKLRGWAKVGNPKEVSVSPSQAAAEEGDSVQFEAEVRDQHGNVIPDVTISWASSAPDVASVDSDGSVHAESEGYSVIEAAVDGVEGSATLTVGDGDGTEPGPAASLTIHPSNWTLVGVGDTVRLEAVAKDADGRTVPDAEVGWSSDDPEIVSITSEGLVTAKEIGAATIVAALVCTASSCEGITASSHGEVEEGEGIPDPGRVTDLIASGSTSTSITVSFTEVDDGTGGPAGYALRYGSPTISWGSASSTEVTIAGSAIGNDVQYEYNHLDPDTEYEFQLVAYRGTLDADPTFGDLSNEASGATDAPEAANVSITPSSATIHGVGNTVQFTAEATDEDGNTVLGVSVQWSSKDPEIATVSPEGLVTAKAVGTVLIAATIACGTSACEEAAPLEVEARGDPDPSDGDPIWVEDFDYEDWSAFIGSNGAYTTRTAGNQWNMIDHEVTPPGWPASFRQMMSDVDAEEKRLNFFLDHSDAFGEPLDEFWYEIWYRYSENWHTIFSDTDCGNPDFKWMFLHTNEWDGSSQNWSRWQLKTVGRSVLYAWEFSLEDVGHRSGDATQEWDGNWRRMRVHYRGSSDFGVPDARIWIELAKPDGDGGFDVSFTNALENEVIEAGVRQIVFGVNLNHKNCIDQTQYLWWGGLRLWDQDPGW